MYCKHCGSSIPDDIAFCTVCGQKVHEDEDETNALDDTNPKQTAIPDLVRCDSCGNLVDTELSYCPHCGSALRKGGNPQNASNSVPDQPGQKSFGPAKIGVLIGILVVALGIGWFLMFGNNLSNTSDPAADSNAIGEGEGSIEGLDEGSDRPFAHESSIVGNLINGGHMASDGNGTFYYAQPVDGTDWNTRSIVCTDFKGRDKKVVYTAPEATQNCYHLSVVGNRLVFNQIIENNSTVVVLNIETGVATTLDTCDDWSLCQVSDGWVYYLKRGVIWRRDLNGNHASSLVRVGSSTLWRIWGQRLVTFGEEGAREVNVSALDGLDSKVVYQTLAGWTIMNAYPVDDTNLVVVEKSDSEDRQVVRLVANGTSQKLDDALRIQRTCGYGDGVLVTQVVDNGAYQIRSVSYAGEDPAFNVTLNNTGQARYTCYLEGHVVFGFVTTDTKQCSVHSIELHSGRLQMIDG